MTRRILAREIAFSVVVGALVALALWPAAASAQEVVPQGAGSPPFADFSAFFSGTLPGLVVASASVAIFLAAARKSFRRWLAPSPSTDLSRALNMVLALALGVPMGMLGIAPAVPAGSVAGNVFGGIVAGSVAVLFRQLLVWGLRSVLAKRVGAPESKADPEDETDAEIAPVPKP